MHAMAVGELKRHFAAVLNEVRQGKAVGIRYGRKKQTMAVIIPVAEYERTHPRTIGILEGKASCSFHDDWSMSDEEFLQS